MLTLIFIRRNNYFITRILKMPESKNGFTFHQNKTIPALHQRRIAS
jgi:hypothetical protein